MKVENWCGRDIRFVEKDGEWWAILKDICDALNLRTAKIAERLDPSMLERVTVESVSNRPTRYKNQTSFEGTSEKVMRTQQMLAVNEIGIYEALFASRKLEARKFRIWSATVMQRLRRSVGLEGYQVMQMTDPDIQDQIDHILDTLYWDEKTGVLMQSVTVAGGDVEQVPFED